MQTDIQNLKVEYERAQNEAQNSSDKNREYEKYLNELNNEAKAFMEDIRNLEGKISNSERELESKTDHLRAV